jgi:hypothetical protein
MHAVKIFDLDPEMPKQHPKGKITIITRILFSKALAIQLQGLITFIGACRDIDEGLYIENFLNHFFASW